MANGNCSDRDEALRYLKRALDLAHIPKKSEEERAQVFIDDRIKYQHRRKCRVHEPIRDRPVVFAGEIGVTLVGFGVTL